MTFDPLAGLFDGLNTTAEGSRNRARPCPGIGTYILEKYAPKQTEKGVIMMASLRVAKPADGSRRPVGDLVEIPWFIYKGAKEGGENEKARARDFVTALLGMPKGTPAGQQSRQLADMKQPGTGIALTIECRENTYKKKDGTTATGQEYTYTHIAGQSGEQIAKQRAWLAQFSGPATEAAPAPAAQPAAPVAPVAAQPAAPAAASPLGFLFPGT